MRKPKATKEDMHLYLTDEDRKNFEAVRKLMVELGLPGSSISQQGVIRFALKRAAQP